MAAEATPELFNDMNRTYFVTGTDTGVGKTIATLVLGSLFQKRGLDIGVFKPVQSGRLGGGDAEFLKKNLGLSDSLREINPYFAKEPLSPHLAFARQGTRIKPTKILEALRVLQERHDVVLIEGAGGLLVPITKTWLMADLARETGAELIIVSRLGLGTINHTLLTVNEAKRRGIRIAGIIFSDASGGTKGLPERTNPRIIRELSGVPVLGIIPRLKKFDLSRVTLNLPNPRGWEGHWAEADKKYVWHPFTQMKDWAAGEPLVIERGEGSYLIDTQGRRYLDGVSSLWVNVHGHRKKELDEALAEQAGKIAHSTMLGLSSVPAIELAKKLVEIAPKGLAKVFYSDNGSTAVEVAIKMSYQYWQNTGEKKKTGIVHLANSYHGDTLGSVSVGGIDLFHQVYRKLVFKAIKLDFPDCYREKPTEAFAAVERFERLLRRDKGKVAALVLEPIVQGASGMIMWPKGVLKRFEQVCRKHDVFLIVDEVATGFGRTGKMFACEHENVRPDLMCVAKGITGGYLPLAATLTTKRVFDGFVFPYQDQKTFFHGHTYTGNPLACAVALKNIEIFEKERTIEGLQPKIKFLASELKKFWDIPFVGDIRQRGFMVGIELVKDRATKEPFPWEERVGAKVCERVRDYGVILRPLGNVIVLMPPLSMSTRELRLLVSATRRSICDVLGKRDVI
jgi:adenosylmethionine-8-amino-7-oxononanoate aminotransferase